MSSLPNSPAVADWFQRLEAAWRRMPTEERTCQREEVQQHLEALVAANVAQDQPLDAAWNAALVQFGDPTQIGRRVYQEWQRTHSWLYSDLAVILFGVSLYITKRISLTLLTLWMLLWPAIHPAGNTVVMPLDTNPVINYTLTIAIYIAIGLRYPYQAIKGALYSFLLLYLWGLFSVALFSCDYPTLKLTQSLSAMLTHSLLRLPLWIAGEVGVAYLASVTKRGWYKPTLDDFKLTLPKRRLRG